jgi:hypothetical protein
MARMHRTDAEDDAPRPHPRHDPSRNKSHLMSLADQVDRTGGPPFPRMLRTPLGAFLSFVLVVVVVALVFALAGGPV